MYDIGLALLSLFLIIFVGGMIVKSYKQEYDQISAKRAKLSELVSSLEVYYKRKYQQYIDLEIRTKNQEKLYAKTEEEYNELLKKYNSIKLQLTQEEQKIKNMLNDIEKEWEDQIDLGVFPENITLSSENRRNFFVHVKRIEKITSETATYSSELFGNAQDAKKFAVMLRSMGIRARVRGESDSPGEYKVWIENENIQRMNTYYQAQQNNYEFKNPCYISSIENHQIVSEEEKLLTALPSSETCESGEDYEEYVAKKLSSMGFKNIELTPTTGDYGADVLCEKQGIKYCVQCKFYSNPVGVGAVQEIFAAKAHYNCARAMVITNNIFTPQARKLAGDNGVVLVDNFT